MRSPRKLSVRRAIDSDLDAVADLWHDSAMSMDGAAVNVPLPDELRKRIDYELARDWHLYVALAGERIIGMLAIKPARSILDQIFVSPRERGAGVGSALIDAAQRAMPNGFSLRADASNGEAGRFYERRGMRRIGAGIHPHTGIPVHFYGWRDC